VTRMVDLNSLLKLANAVVAGLLVFAYLYREPNEYVDGTSVLLAILLCLQTHVALVLERHRRDPFVILLAFEMTFYYAFRVFTLTLSPFSLVFDRFGYGPGDSNFALTFILIANLFLYAGFHVVALRNDYSIDATKWRPTSPLSIICLMLAVIVLAYFSRSYWTEDNMPRALTVLVVFFSPVTIVLMALAYCFVFRKSLSKATALAIFGLIVLEVVVHILWGSRSAIIAFVVNAMIVGLAVFGCIRLKRAQVILAGTLLPLAAIVLISAFAISTYVRATREDVNATLDIGPAVDAARESGADLLINPALETLLPLIAARAGYFDFAAEIIANQDQYGAVINTSSYGISIVDNILTPGMDVFDHPMTANALRFVYEYGGTPSKRAAAEAYHSDQLTLYGELYVLFGYACLPMLFFLAVALKRLLATTADDRPFALVLKRIVVLYLFVRLLESFGFDWIIGEMLPLVGSILIYRIVFASRRVSASRRISGPETPNVA
jgi:hypothetical protein